MKRYFIVSAIVGSPAMASFSPLFAAPFACEGNFQKMEGKLKTVKLGEADIKVASDLQDSATKHFAASDEYSTEDKYIDVMMSTLSSVSARSA